MARAGHTTQPSLLRRVFSSVLMKMIVFVVLFLFLSAVMINGTSVRILGSETNFIADAVRRSAVQCYALEGRFPDNLSYLEENYGLAIDHRRYSVYYESMGANLLPQIRVIPVAK